MVTFVVSVGNMAAYHNTVVEGTAHYRLPSSVNKQLTLKTTQVVGYFTGRIEFFFNKS